MEIAAESEQQGIEMANIRRIAVLRALQLGDLLVAVPALRRLRQLFPQAEISLISLPWAESFAQRFSHYIDRFVPFAGYPGIPEVAVEEEKIRSFIEAQQAYSYDLAIQMHGSGETSNPCILAFHARMSAGCYNGSVPEGLTCALPYRHERHEIRRNIALVEEIRASLPWPVEAVQNSTQPAAMRHTNTATQHRMNTTVSAANDPVLRLEFPLDRADYREAETLVPTRRERCQLVIALHPGARPPARRWPTEHFARLADELVRQCRARILFTGGPGERTTVQNVLRQMQNRTEASDLSEKTSLGGLAAVISQVNLFISNDTGPAHLACAVNTPSITLFGPADSQRWAPLDQQWHPVARRPVACSPCSHWECPIDHRCLRWLEPMEIVDIACHLLERTAKKERICND